ncbi:MAG: BrnT family toxin [Candidatus Marinimicrobia bacterium]|nr:BrnT family toxin [Candidatus Neomarinimicrobiota bacterium]
MGFEFDDRKSLRNKQKHGIDFNQARALSDDPDLIEIPARTDDEPRYLVIGKITGRHWSGIITYRGDRIRIISMRRSRPEEIALYEGYGTG